MIQLVADSSCDIHTLPGASFGAVPLTISTDDGKAFVDDALLSIPELLTHLREHKGRSYTACPSVSAWMDAFGGADTVYAVTITGALSGSYNSARIAADLYQQAHAEASVHVFDSLSTGPEVLLILEKLRDLVDENLDFDRVVSAVEEYQKKTRLFFSLHSLHNLAQNGRVSKVAAAAVGVMNIRVIGTASQEGTLESLGKARGDKKANAALLEQMLEAGYSGGKVRIAHVQNESLAQTFAAQVRGLYPQADIQVLACGGLCSYYAEKGSLMVGIETD